MIITEKLYIEWLEKIVKKYKENLCDHCPKEESDEIIMEGDTCVICDRLTKKYMQIKSMQTTCPCHYFAYHNEDINMVKVAWKVIRGWKKDNKDKINAKT